MASSISDDEGRVVHKRMVHNEVERRRKVKINNWIYRLGDLLPGCSDDKKISKNGILERAVEYLKELQENNDKLLLGHCSEVQVSEFQRMKERIRELELRNTELTRIVDSSGITVDLEAIWQQRGKYSHKIEPESVTVTIDCQVTCAAPSFVDNKVDSKVDKLRPLIKEKPLLPKSGETKFSSCANNVYPAKGGENVAVLSQDGIVVLHQGVPKQESQSDAFALNPCKTLDVSQLNGGNPSCGSQEFISTSLLPNGCVTAVTQALPSLPIMSTSQQSGNQQLLQQLPVLNYGNTVNIFPGLAGQTQPMIIINDQGVPLLQNLIPGQMILQSGTGQPVTLQGSNSVHSNSLISNKNPGNIVTMTNELGNAGNGTVLLSTLMGQTAPTGMSAGMGSNQIIVNTGGLPNPNTGQVLVNSSLSQPFFSTGSAITNNAPNLVANNHVIISSSSLTPAQAEVSTSFAGALHSAESQNLIPTSTFNGPNNFMTTRAPMHSNNPCSSGGNPLLGKAPLANSMVLGCPANATIPLQQSQALVMRNSKPLVQSPAPVLTHDQGFNNRIINQMTCIPSHENAVHLFPRQGNGAGGQQVMPINSNGNAPGLPSALLLPNGQIIPVVSQPSLLYPGSAPVNGGLLMTASSTSTILQSSTASNNPTPSHFKTIISKDSVKMSQLNPQVPPVPVSTAVANCLSAPPSSTSAEGGLDSAAVFPPQGESTNVVSSVDVVASKKSRKSQRVLKPKPAASAATKVAPQTTSVASSQQAMGNGVVAKEFVNAKTETVPATNSVPAPAPVPPQPEPLPAPPVKTYNLTNDILAKATESIFATSVSESSSPTHLYGCEPSAFCGSKCNPNDAAPHDDVQNPAEKQAEPLEQFAENPESHSQSTDNLHSHDVFNLVANVYSTEDKDMPTLEPISPTVKPSAMMESTTGSDESLHDRHAPRLSLMIGDDSSNEIELPSKRTHNSKLSVPSKRQKPDLKAADGQSSKALAEELPPTTQSVSFMSISQLASSNFTMDASLTSNNSPLASISPLLASPTKSIGPENFLNAGASSYTPPSSSLLLLTAQPGPQNTNVPCIGGHDLANPSPSCEESASISVQAIDVDESAPDSKSANAASSNPCSGKLSVKGTENFSIPASGTNRTVSTSIYNTVTTYAKTAENSLTATSASNSVEAAAAARNSTSMLHSSCASLVHFPPSSQHLTDAVIHHGSAMNNLALVDSSHNALNGAYTAENHVSSGESTAITYSIAATLAATQSSSIDSITVHTSSNSLPSGTCSSNNMNSALQNQSFNITDMIPNNISSGGHGATFSPLGTHLTTTLDAQAQCVSEASELSANVISDTVPSFNFGMFTQHGHNQTHSDGISGSQLPLQGVPHSFGQNFFTQAAAPPLEMRTQSSLPNPEGKNKNGMGQRANPTEAMMLPAGLPPSHGSSNNNNLHASMGALSRTLSHTSPSSENQQTSRSDPPPVFPSHRSTVGTTNYSAEALIGQTGFAASQKQLPQTTMRPCLSYSAESLLQSQTDRRSHCIQNSHSRHQPNAVGSQPSSSSYGNVPNPPQSTYSYFSLQPNSKRSSNNQSCTVTNFHSTTANKMSCTHPHQQHGEMPFSFTLSQSNGSHNSEAQIHPGPMYANMLHYPPVPPSSGVPARNSKQGSLMQAPMFGQESVECASGNGQQHGQNCSNYVHNSINTFGSSFPVTAGRNMNAGAIPTLIPDTAKLAQDKPKAKQENHMNKNSNAKAKQSGTSKKKLHSVEEVNLSNSIFETNRSTTPYFGIPNLSPPRNEAPTYLANPNLFGTNQRPVGGNATQQNKPTDLAGPYNPLFASRSQTGLNLNFQAPGFSVNHIHGNASTVPNPITNHNNVPNFNLSNIFPDINNSGENLSPIKFHPGNPIIPSEGQHHQSAAAGLYNRPVLHNGMSINSFLAHNPHNFDGRPPVPMPINNTVPPNFHGHGHTPTFSNVIPTLNFSMHDH